VAIIEHHIDPFTDILMRKMPALLVGDREELDAYLTTVHTDVKIANTKANVHCHMVAHDGNEMPRVKDLAEALVWKIVDYAIPRSEIKKANEQYAKTGSFTALSKLHIKAKNLFTTLKKTGEAGEILLYVLIQHFLGIPQILCKMPLKTSSHMHVHGTDGIHAILDPQTQKLALYWGEAKLYQSIDQAITKCLESIAPFFDDGGSGSARTRDLYLLRDNLDLVDEELENALLTFLNPEHRNVKRLEFRGACLIGFDCSSYPNAPHTKVEAVVQQEVSQAFSGWKRKLGKGIAKHAPLDKFVLEVFFIPFPSVDAFREAFLEEIGNG
jgi:hypothetical protein